MPFQNFKRQGFFAVSITVLGLSAQPALSSPASDLLDKYNAWYLESGFEKASYAEAIESGNTTEIRDYNVAGVFSIKNEEGEPTATFYADVTIPKMVFTGSAVDGDVFSYDSLTVGKATFDIRVLEEDSAVKEIANAKNLKPVAQFSGSMTDYTISDFSEKWVDHPVLKEGISQEAFLQLLGMSLNTSYGSSAINEMSLTFNIADEFVSDTVLTGFKTGSIKDGVTEAISLERYASTGKSKISGEHISSNVATNTVTSYKNLKIDRLDARPLLAYFKLADAPSANYIGSYTTEDISLEMSIDGAKAHEPIGFLSMTAASTSAKDLSIKDGDGLKLLSIFENLDTKSDEDQEMQLLELFDALGSYNIGYSDIKDLEVKSWDPIRAKRMNEVAPSFEMKLASVSMTDFSLSGIGNITLEGFHGAVEGDDAVFDVGTFEIANVAWPSMREFVETAKTADQNPEAAMELVPTIGKFSIKNAEGIADDLDTPISLKELTIEMDGHIGPIPTSVSDVVSGLSFDAALLQEPMVLGVFERLGIERVTLNQDFKIAWDENTEDLTLEKFEFELENGLKLRADIQLGGIPRSLFEKPHEAEAVIALATFKGAQIEVMDSPLISELLAAQAEQAGVPAEMLASMMIDGSLQQAGPLAETEFALELANAAKKFAGKPTNIRVTLAPQSAVPLMQLGGLAALAPQQLPELLGATVTYTE
ncbi:hypothetical protein ACMG4P_06160 [Pseudovibrio denitrificans]|uniref:hypothetical protein n=1 Tax=Pseudovibrio denitrificans TaxID=258256 RepID=UPI0039BFC5E1